MSVTNNKFQDLQENNSTLWKNFKTYWENGEYVQALSILSQTSLNTQEFNAQTINLLNNNLSYLQTLNDPTFKQNKIISSVSPPAQIIDGQIWFKINTII